MAVSIYTTLKIRALLLPSQQMKIHPSLSLFLSFHTKTQQVNEIDEIVKSIQKTPGFNAYLILNNDGVVLRWEQVKSSNVNTTGSTTTTGTGSSSGTTSNSSSSGGGNAEGIGTSTTVTGSASNEDEQQSQQLYEQPPLTYEKAVQYSHHILDLCNKSKDNMKELFKSNGSGSSSGNNNGHGNGATEGDHHHTTTTSGTSDEGEEYEVESIRVRTDSHELIIAQEGNYILVVIYVGQKNGNGGDFSQDAVLGDDTK